MLTFILFALVVSVPLLVIAGGLYKIARALDELVDVGETALFWDMDDEDLTPDA